jgi:hypothetical protein
VRRLTGAVLVALVLCAPAWAAPRIKLAKGATHQRDTIITVEAEGGGDEAQYLWDVEGPAPSTVESGGTLYLAGPPGEYKLTLTMVNFTTKKIQRTKATVTIVDGNPPGPPGPGPGPGPNPPNPPNPPQPPAPIAEAGFRVLIVYDPKALATMPDAQKNVLYAGALRDYLNAKCVLGPDGKTKEWRVWANTVDPTAEAKLWQDAFKRPKGTLPAILISNGKTGYEGPLPDTIDKTLELLKKYEPTGSRAKRKGR